MSADLDTASGVQPVNGSGDGAAAEAAAGDDGRSVGGHEHATLHLLTADLSLDEFRRYGSYLAVCGQWVPAHSLPDSECPPGCEGSVYCEDCTRTAAEAVGLVAEQLGAAR